MTTGQDASMGSKPAPRRPALWRRAALAAASVAVAGAGLFASTELHGIPAPQATTARLRVDGAGMPFRLVDDAPAPHGRAAAAPGAAAAALAPDSPFIGAFKGSPESRLINIYRAIGQDQTQVAIDAAAALTHDVPNFHLAQWVYADLLSARMGNSLRFGPPTLARAPAGAASNAALSAELGDLREEALLRLQALHERPPADKVPAEFILLPKAIHHAIAVDTSRSRLYLFENGARGLRLVSDHYVSVGKQGVDKSVEGDQRTPLGVYFVSDRVEGGALDPSFGSGAMQLNYPNLFDKLHGRTGSGIYLHGVPFNTYSRPPKDSDGCITLANDDLLMLMNTVPLHDTPVIVTRQIHWVADNATQVHRAEIIDAVNRWQSLRAANDRTSLAALYDGGATPVAPLAVSPPAAVPAFVMVHGKRRPVAAPSAPAPTGPAQMSFDNLSVLTWADDTETMVVTFHERASRLNRDAVLRQYWERGHDSDQWKIVAEGLVR